MTRRPAPRRASRVRLVTLVALVVAFYAVSWHLARVDLGKLATGLPKMAGWARKAWPPATDELPVLLQRAAETVAMAALGTTLAAIWALPVCVLAARNVTPSRLLYPPTRWFLNALRGIDSFVFALLFVAAVGLGPFAGVLGIALHTWGSTAKLWAEAIENVPPGPMEAAAVTGASRLKVMAYALLPDVAPNMVSTALFWWEFNVRASTVLGVVGAGGIGQELKNSMDLLDFPRLFTIILIILVMVTVIDRASQWLRAKLDSILAAEILRVQGVRKRFRSVGGPDDGTAALDGVSFRVNRGEFVAVLGPSGAGKTTLFRCLTGLTRPDGGSVYLQGRPIGQGPRSELTAARREVAVIFQQFNLIRRLTALQNTLAGRLAKAPTWRVLLRRFSKLDQELALRCLDRVGLSDRALVRADQLSGGQQQRVAIARALAQEATLILADEPVASLDPESAANVLDTLRAVTAQGITVLASLHQVHFAQTYGDRILALRAGRVVFDVPAALLSTDAIQRIYGAPDAGTPDVGTPDA